MSTRVPAGLQARRRDLPALAWVVSMAYSASTRQPRWLHRSRGIVGWSAWLTVLVIAVPLGAVCAIDRHAALIAQNRHQPLRTRIGRTVLALPVAVVVAVVLLVAPALALVDLGWWLLSWERTSPWFGHSILIGALTPIVVAALGTRPAAVVGGNSAALAPVIKELAASTESGQPVWLLSLLAAWPQDQGHGRRLLRAVFAPGALPGSVVLTARDDRLVETYHRYGMQRRGGGRVMVRLAGSTTGGHTTPLRRH